MEIKNNFLKGRMNKDLDSRLVSNGEYRDALNIRISNSDSSDVGALQNTLGNTAIADAFSLSSATCIGSEPDIFNNLIYYFITSATKDLIVEFDITAGTFVKVLEDVRGASSVLNFSTSNKITGIDIIKGDDASSKQLAWTDNLNPPRKIYIDTAKALAADAFDTYDISVIKRPPTLAPDVSLISDTSVLNTNKIADKYFLFSYRYIYEGNEYSSNSFFSKSIFSDTTSGVANLLNSINVVINTGGTSVKGFEVLSTEVGSGIIKIIKRIDKNLDSVASSISYSVTFSNKETYGVLDSNASNNIFNNVPLLAKDQKIVGNRLMYFNYTDGENNIIGTDFVVDKTYGEQKIDSSLVVSSTTTVYTGDTSTIDFTAGTSYAVGDVISFIFSTQTTYPYYPNIISTKYTITGAYTGGTALFANVTEFNALSANIIAAFAANDQSAGAITVTVSSVGDILKVIIDDSPRRFSTLSIPLYLTSYASIDGKSLTYKSEYSQEFGITYYDDFNRSSSVQTSNNNVISFDEILTGTRATNTPNEKIGKAQLTIKSLPPSWATKYKIVRRSNDYNYEIISPLTLYFDSSDVFYYFQLDGNDINKVDINSKLQVVYINNVTPVDVLIFDIDSIVATSDVAISTATGAFVAKGESYIKCKLNRGTLPTGSVFDTTTKWVSIDTYILKDNDSLDTFYETPQTFLVTGGYHMGNTTNQSSGVDAVIDLEDGDSYILSDNLEHYKSKDEFNASKFENVYKGRGNLVSKDYKQTDRYASATYSEPYSADNNVNGLSTFNLSLANYKDLDKTFGSIDKAIYRNGDLTVFQESQVSKVLVNKSLTSNADASGNIITVPQVLGTQIPYVGKYGSAGNPESIVYYGNNVYFLDENRGAVLRLGANGIDVISDNGMISEFRTVLKTTPNSYKPATYDTFNNEYLVSIGNYVYAFKENVKGFTSKYSFVPDELVSLNNKTYSFKAGAIWLHDSGSVYNNFYGVQGNSTVKLLVNQHPSNIKTFDAISLEQSKNDASLTIKTFLSDESTDITTGALSYSDFVKKEGIYYANFKRNTSTTDLTGVNIYGLGTVKNVTNWATKKIELNNNSLIVPNGLSEGDTVYISSSGLVVGIVKTYVPSATGGELEFSAVTTLPSVSDFLYAKKALTSLTGGDLRGYAAEIELTVTSTGKYEIFAVNTEVNLSNV